MDQRPQPAPFFLLRTPVLPAEVLTAAPISDLDHAQDPHSEPGGLGKKLTRLLGDPLFRRALEVGCPAFARIEADWLQTDDVRAKDDALRALAGYVYRMAGRAEPYGLFAAVSTGTVGGSKTSLRVDDTTQTEWTRAALAAFMRLSELPLSDVDFADSLTWEPSPGIYRVGGQLRCLVDARESPSERPRMVAVEWAPEIECLLQRAKTGARRAGLIGALTDIGVAPTAAQQAVDDVIASGLLVPLRGAAPPVDTVGQRLAAWLDDNAPRHAPAARRLAAAGRQMRLVSFGAPLAEDAVGGRHLETPLTDGGGFAERIHTELLRAANANLDTILAGRLADAIVQLHRLGMGHPDPMRAAREVFVDRFSDEQVSLLEALDPDVGIGRLRTDPEPQQLSPSVSRVLLDGVLEAARSNRTSLILPLELKSLVGGLLPPVPERFCAVGAVLQEGDLKAQAYLEGAYGSTGVHLLARHALSNNALHTAITTWLKKGDGTGDGVIVADVVHLPGGRASDVAAAPLVSDYEIVLDDRGGRQGSERRIYLDDLFLSVRNGRFELRSRRCGREVLPVVGSAYDPSTDASAPYRFLCSLQHQGTAPCIAWNWGSLGVASSLPRVILNGIVVSPRQWRLSSPIANPAALRDWQRAHAAPRWVRLLRKHKTTLLFDLEEPVCQAALLRELRQSSEALLYEALPTPDHAVVEGRAGRYSHDFILPFATPTRPRMVPTVDRLIAPRPTPFLPGSEWLFLKLYAAPASLDGLLQWLEDAVLGPCADNVARWHFLRVTGDEPHLRLRLNATRANGRLHLLAKVTAALQAGGARAAFSRAQFDTYVPEAARYGGQAAMTIAHRLFHQDSLAAMRLIQPRHLGDGGEENQMHAAASGVHRLFEDFGVSAGDRRTITLTVREALSRAGKRRAGRLPSTAPNVSISDILAARSRAWAPDIARLKALHRAGQCAVDLKALAVLHAHLHINRTLSDPSEAAELAVFEHAEGLKLKHAPTARRD